VLRKAWLGGTVMAGTSAGALCWHTGGTTSSFGPGIHAETDALGRDLPAVIRGAIEPGLHAIRLTL